MSGFGLGYMTEVPGSFNVSSSLQAIMDRLLRCRWLDSIIAEGKGEFVFNLGTTKRSLKWTRPRNSREGGRIAGFVKDGTTFALTFNWT